jgi:hypothetical protein
MPGLFCHPDIKIVASAAGGITAGKPTTAGGLKDGVAMPGLRGKLIIAVLLAAAASATAGCTTPLTIDCAPYTCTA